MAISSLATVRIPAYIGNYTQNRASIRWNDATQERTTNGNPSSIKKVTIHHMAAVSSAEQCGQTFKSPYRKGSAHYGIGNDGTIANYVDENDVAWSDSNFYSNCHSVTIETSNSATGGQWPVSNAALNSLIKLVADIAKRNNIGKLVPGKTLTWHQMYAATACPGPYLLSKMWYIADEANKIMNTNPRLAKVQAAPNNRYLVNGFNRDRYENELIVYSAPYKTSNTNNYGYEVLTDKNGIVLSDPAYSGNHAIPAGGRVISGHGQAANWIKANIKAGYQCYVDDEILYIEKKQCMGISSVNGPRWTNYLCVYDKQGSTTGTNQWGVEVAVDRNGNVISGFETAGNMKVPAGGYVLSGHGTMHTWMTQHIKKGSKLTLNSTKTIIVVN